MTDRKARRLAPLLASGLGLAATFAVQGGCFEVTDLPCPGGGAGCPTGYFCDEGQCRIVGEDGAIVNVYVNADGVARQEDDPIYFESYLGVHCVLGRDPDAVSDAAMEAGRQADLHASVSAEVATPVRIPAGQQAMFVRIPPRAGDERDVARACIEITAAEGGRYDEYFTLLRANGGCGDSVWDPREECDDGPEGSASCTSECLSQPVVIDGSGCHSSLAADCMEPRDDDGRCLVGWLRDRGAVVVAVLNPDGTRDDGANRGIDQGVGSPAGLRIVARDEHAAAVWRSDGGGAIQVFDRVGQRGASYPVEGEPWGGVATLAGLRMTEGGVPNPIGGWLTEEGHLVIEAAASGDRWEGDLGIQLSHGAVATLVGDRAFVAWGVDVFTEEGETEPADGDGAVVAAWIDFGGEPTARGPFLVPDLPEWPQTEPAVAAVSDSQVLVLWTDENNVHEDSDGTGIRSRLLRADGDGGAPLPVNGGTTGNQSSPSIAVGDGYAVATWVDGPTGQLMGRFLDPYGRPMARTFGDGSTEDFVVTDRAVAGTATVVAGDQTAYFFWLQGGCGERGGGQVVLRMLPRPR